MASNNSFTYCDSDEEVFFGKVTEKDIRKRALLGPFDSPVVKCSTPRPSASSKLGVSNSVILPDVLSDSVKKSLASNYEEPETKRSEIISLSLSVEGDECNVVAPLEKAGEPSKNNDKEVSIDPQFESDMETSQHENIDLSSSEEGNESCSIFQIEKSGKPSMNVSKQVSMEPELDPVDDVDQLDEVYPETYECEIINISSSEEGNESFNVLEIENSGELRKIEDNEVSIDPQLESDTETNEHENIDLSSSEEGNESCNIFQIEKPGELSKNNEKKVSMDPQLEIDSETIECEKIGLSSSEQENGSYNVFQIENSEPSSKLVSMEPELEVGLGTYGYEILHVSSSEEGNESFEVFELGKSDEQCNNDHTRVLVDTELEVDAEANESEKLNVSLCEECTKSSEVSQFDKSCDVSKDEKKYLQHSKLAVDAETNDYEKIDPLSVEALIQASIHLENQSTNLSEKKTTPNLVIEKPTAEVNKLNDFDYSLLNGISDSVLNISIGSTLCSSPEEETRKSYLGSQTNVIHEEISCDGEHMLDDLSEHEDLHMSVDEPDFKNVGLETGSITSNNASQHSFYTSCLNSDSSYITALDNSRFQSSVQQTSDLFHSYRENLNNSILTEEADKQDDLETSFEMVMKNRQNSFTDTVSETVASPPGQVKPKIVSKLPVLQSSTSLLKPPKFNIKPEKLMASNYKWAKKLPMGANKTVLAEVKQTNLKTKIPTTNTKTRATVLPNPTPIKTNLSKTPNAKLNIPCGNKVKTPVENKTPARGFLCQSSRLVKSDTKIPTIMNPANKKYAVSESKGWIKKSPALLLNKNERYKNVVSPIQRYITDTPVVLLRKETVKGKTEVCIIDSNKTPSSHIPIKELPKGNTIKRLDFDSNQGQENVDPNYLRDTLPPRTLEKATAVFMKEPEVPKKHLPKLGGKMQKLLDTPRPKVVVHHGRSRESPKVKGVLILNHGINSDGIPQSTQSPGDIRYSIRQEKSPEKSNLM